MGLTDPIADMLTILRNTSRVKKETAEVSFSKMNQAILEILKREGYIKDFKVMSKGAKKKIKVYLMFNSQGEPSLKGLKRISKPGLRVYVNHKRIPYVLRGLGIAILSTSKGILTDKEARKKGIGGELLCYIY